MIHARIADDVATEVPDVQHSIIDMTRLSEATIERVIALPYAPLAMPKQRLERDISVLAHLWLMATGGVVRHRVGH